MSQLLNEKMSVDPHSLTSMRGNTYGGPNAQMKPRKMVRRVDNIGEDNTTDVIIKETEPEFNKIVKRLKRVVRKSERDFRLEELGKYIQNAISLSMGNQKKGNIDPNEIKLLKYLVSVGQFLEKSSNSIKSDSDFRSAIMQLATTLQGKD
jgi:hypothetical protein